MSINIAKTKEIVFRRPHPPVTVDATPVSEVEQIEGVKLLGVILSDNLCFNSQVNFILKLSVVSGHIL